MVKDIYFSCKTIQRYPYLMEILMISCFRSAKSRVEDSESNMSSPSEHELHPNALKVMPLHHRSGGSVPTPTMKVLDTP